MPRSDVISVPGGGLHAPAQPREHSLLHLLIAQAEERGDRAERRRLLVAHVGRWHPRTRRSLVLRDLGVREDDLTERELATLGWRRREPPPPPSRRRAAE